MLNYRGTVTNQSSQPCYEIVSEKFTKVRGKSRILFVPKR